MIHEHLSFHAQAGIRVVYTFQNGDGTPRDMTLETVEISVNNGFRKPLLNIEGAPHKKLLILTGAELPTILGKKAEYVVLDKSENPAEAVAGGNLVVTGWL